MDQSQQSVGGSGVGAVSAECAALIAALEKATGPDRRLDGLIFKAIEERPGDDWQEFGDGVWCRRCKEDSVAFDTPEYFTASIDAAMTLRPQGTTYLLCDHEQHPEVYAFIYRRAPDIANTEQFVGKSTSPAVALCIAALKARGRS